MTVRIEAGSIIQETPRRWRRLLVVTSHGFRVVDKNIYAKTKEELEIIDHENFMKE